MLCYHSVWEVETSDYDSAHFMRHPGKGIEGGRAKPGLRMCEHFHRKEYLGEMDLKSKEKE